MSAYEYKVVPAPARAEKIKGVSAPEMRFAMSIEKLINHHAAEGWEYLRAETLPSEERRGLAGRTTQQRTLLVFRRAIAAVRGEPAPRFERDRGATRDTEAAPERAALGQGAPAETGRATTDSEERIAIPGVLRAAREHDERGVADKPAGRRLWAVRPDDDESP